MEQLHKDLSAFIGAVQIIKIIRLPEIEDEIEGYVVGVSELFVMLHALDPNYINLNGYIVLRVADIRSYQIRNDHDFFLNKALNLKGISPEPQPQIDLSNFQTLFTSANNQFPLITIHMAIEDEHVCYIGKVQNLTKKTVTLKEISPAATWERARRYNFEDITRVDFGGGYEAALDMVANHEAETIK